MTTSKVTKTKTSVKKVKRKPISFGVRYDVLARANFKCQACGKNPKRTVLEIDHKIPIAKGRTNAIANLQVLCVACNRGKGAKLKRKRKMYK
jgi:5-methylcytosine-specific restriction endonuclease McrA